jgi:alpha-N-acetylglucosaminidase
MNTKPSSTIPRITNYPYLLLLFSNNNTNNNRKRSLLTIIFALLLFIVGLIAPVTLWITSSNTNLKSSILLPVDDSSNQRPKPIQNNKPIIISTSITGIQSLAKRRIPIQDIPYIAFQLVIPSTSTNTTDDDGDDNKDMVMDTFKYIIKTNNQVQIRGSSLIALSHGLFILYQRECNITLLSWSDDSRPSRPCFASSSTKTPHQYFSQSTPFTYRYAFNVVTFSYSFKFWDFSRWERELDWLAFRGVNLALMHVGQESIFKRAFAKCKPTPTVENIAAFFNSIAYMAWNRMGNIHGIGERMTEKQHQEQLLLAHQILQRMIQLGIDPILPAFSGFVPSQLATLHDRRTIGWSGFSLQDSNVPRVDPFTDRHDEIATIVAFEVLKEFEQELKFQHTIYFSADIFNENGPTSSDEQGGLHRFSRSLLDPVERAVNRTNQKTKSNKKVKLVVQGWFIANDFYYWTTRRARAFVNAFPRDQLILLDLHGEFRPIWKRLRLDPSSIVFCTLHNFGGGNGLGGELRDGVLSNALEAKMAGLRGIGIAPEGVGDSNEIIYDFALGMGWWSVDDIINIDKQLLQWVVGRYRLVVGSSASVSSTTALFDTWKCAVDTVYSRPHLVSGGGVFKSIVEIRPVTIGLRRVGFMPTEIFHDASKFALCSLILVSESLKTTGQELLLLSIPSISLDYDVVDFTRQVLSDLALRGVGKTIEYGVPKRNLEIILFAKELMDGIFIHLSQLLCVHPSFRTPIGLTRDDKMILTNWHERNLEGTLADYASRQLGGGLLMVHQQRWELFWSRLIDQMKKQQLLVQQPHVSAAAAAAAAAAATATTTRTLNINDEQLMKEYKQIEMAWVDSSWTESEKGCVEERNLVFSSPVMRSKHIREVSYQVINWALEQNKKLINRAPWVASVQQQQ